MSRDLFRRILSLSLESLVPSSQTTNCSLIGRPSGVIAELGITNRYSTLAYPQGNGQVEAVNRVIVSRLKKRLDDTKENG